MVNYVEDFEDDFEDGLDDPENQTAINDDLLGEFQKTTSYLKDLHKKFTQIVDEDDETQRCLKEYNLGNARVRIMERDISYIDDLENAAEVFYSQQLGMKYRRVEAFLNKGEISFDGANYLASSGDIKFRDLSFDLKGLSAGFLNKQKGDSFFTQTVYGSGFVWLKDTTSFLEVMTLTNDKIIMDNGTYFASVGNFKQNLTADTKVSSVLFSNKQLITTALVGSGIVILELPVRKSEMIRIKVTKDMPAMIDSNVVLFRQGDVKRGEKLTNGLLGSAVNGLGLVETYTGTGYVYIAPTLNKLTKKLNPNIEHLED